MKSVILFIAVISALFSGSAEAKIKASGIEAFYCPNVLATSLDATTAETKYASLLKGGTTNATETSVDDFIVPKSLVAHSLRALTATAPGAGANPWTITLRDDAAATVLTCDITGTNTSCTNTGSLVSIAAGSKLTVSAHSTGGGTPSAATAEVLVSFCTNEQ
jgi:hypothetical protein